MVKNKAAFTSWSFIARFLIKIHFEIENYQNFLEQHFLGRKTIAYLTEIIKKWPIIAFYNGLS